MPYCPGCNTKLFGVSGLCPMCGTKLPETPEEELQAQVQEPRQEEELPEEEDPEQMEPPKLSWGFGWNKNKPAWPKDAEGKKERAVFLIHVLDLDMDGEAAISLLQAYGIPVVRNAKDGGQLGRVVLGFSGFGEDLYVPESRLEEAKELLSATPVWEDH